MRGLDVNVEVGAGETEDDADLVLGQQHCVHIDTTFIIKQRNHKRYVGGGCVHSAHEVRALAPVKDGPGDVYRVYFLRLVTFPQVRLDLLGDQGHVLFEVFEVHIEPAIEQNAFDEGGDGGATAARHERGLFGVGRRGAELRAYILDVRVEACESCEAHGHRVEEALSQFQVMATHGNAGVPLLDRRPERSVAGVRGYIGLDRFDSPGDVVLIQVQPHLGIFLQPVPVALLEPLFSLAGYVLEVKMVRGEGVFDSLRGMVCQLGVCLPLTHSSIVSCLDDGRWTMDDGSCPPSSIVHRPSSIVRNYFCF